MLTVKVESNANLFQCYACIYLLVIVIFLRLFACVSWFHLGYCRLNVSLYGCYIAVKNLSLKYFFSSEKNSVMPLRIT